MKLCRIIYRSQIYIQEDIKNFVPTNAQLDYPKIILDATGGSKNGSKTSDPKSRSLHAKWYPPLEKTLKLLSMLYRCIDSEVRARQSQVSIFPIVHNNDR